MIDPRWEKPVLTPDSTIIEIAHLAKHMDVFVELFQETMSHLMTEGTDLDHLAEIQEMYREVHRAERSDGDKRPHCDENIVMAKVAADAAFMLQDFWRTAHREWAAELKMVERAANAESN